MQISDATGPPTGGWEALLFDFDGTLWDCEPMMFQAYDEYFRSRGHPLPPERWRQLMGTIELDPWEYLEELLGEPVDRAVANQAVECRKRELLVTGRARAGVVHWLAEADAMDLRRVIVSNSRREWVRRYARQCGIDHGWQFVECAEGDRARAKPSPELYRSALARLGVLPGRAVSFEDSPAGITAAKRAGVVCVAVACEPTAGAGLLRADLYLDSFESTDLRSLLRQLGSLASAA